MHWRVCTDGEIAAPLRPSLIDGMKPGPCRVPEDLAPPERAISVGVIIVASQAIDPGSNPGWRIFTPAHVQFFVFHKRLPVRYQIAREKNVGREQVQPRAVSRGEAQKYYPRWDSNPQSSAPETDALSIRPLGLLLLRSLLCFHAMAAFVQLAAGSTPWYGPLVVGPVV